MLDKMSKTDVEDFGETLIETLSEKYEKNCDNCQHQNYCGYQVNNNKCNEWRKER